MLRFAGGAGRAFLALVSPAVDRAGSGHHGDLATPTPALPATCPSLISSNNGQNSGNARTPQRSPYSDTPRHQTTLFQHPLCGTLSHHHGLPSLLYRPCYDARAAMLVYTSICYPALRLTRAYGRTAPRETSTPQRRIVAMLNYRLQPANYRPNPAEYSIIWLDAPLSYSENNRPSLTAS